MKLLYESDYHAQKDIKLSFYDLQRKRYHDGEKDGNYQHGDFDLLQINKIISEKIKDLEDRKNEHR